MQRLLTDTSGLDFRKPGKCDNSGPNCAQLAALPGGAVAFGSSHVPNTAIVLDAGEFAALVGAVKDGQYDDLLS